MWIFAVLALVTVAVVLVLVLNQIIVIKYRLICIATDALKLREDAIKLRDANRQRDKEFESMARNLAAILESDRRLRGSLDLVHNDVRATFNRVDDIYGHFSAKPS